MKNRPQHIHIVGICGVTMAPLAVLYKEMGWKVTGSDRAFFPPMSTYLEQNGIQIMPGFKKGHLKQAPDLVLVNAFITEKNPEVIEAKKRSVPVKVYADVLPELIEKENSVVIAGDCGKTSTTALVAWVLEKSGYNPSFMIGGLPKNFEHGIRRTNSSWSVMEGDEYVAASWDDTPRFLYYHPKFLILTDIQWDHMDKFPSEKQYVSVFEKLVQKVPKDGLIVANREGENVALVVKQAKAKIIFYEGSDAAPFPMSWSGNIWRQNSAAAITLGRCIGLKDSEIAQALQTFQGIKRRQEVRYQDERVVVIDDNAHTPIKVAGALQAIGETFPQHSLCVVYEPGNRSAAALNLEGYHTCFSAAEAIFLPRVSAANEEVQNFNEKLAAALKKYYKNCFYLPKDEEILLHIQKTAKESRSDKQKIAFVFMSQKGFRGMIEETISLLQSP